MEILLASQLHQILGAIEKDCLLHIPPFNYRVLSISAEATLRRRWPTVRWGLLQWRALIYTLFLLLTIYSSWAEARYSRKFQLSVS